MVDNRTNPGGNSHDRSKRSAQDDRVATEVFRRITEVVRNQEPPNRFFVFIEHPAVLGVVFLLGSIVGTLLFTPAFILCGLCLLLGIHRAGVVKGLSRAKQVLAYIAICIVMTMGGYFLYNALDRALGEYTK